jgi:hypothetical protein
MKMIRTVDMLENYLDETVLEGDLCRVMTRVVVSVGDQQT